MTELSDIHRKLGSICARIGGHQRDLEKKVDRDEFLPVKLLVYGLVALMLTIVFTALITDELKNRKTTLTKAESEKSQYYVPLRWDRVARKKQ